MPCICCERGISQEKFFAEVLQPEKSAKYFDLENFRVYGIDIALHMIAYNMGYTCSGSVQHFDALMQ